MSDFRRGVELVLNGYIGKVKRVEVGLPSGHADFAGTGDKRPNCDPPKEVDYNFWVGPSEMIPFNPCRFHKNWRWCYNFGGGQLMDWIGHHNDIAHWGLSSPKYGCGPDDRIGPLEVAGTAEFPPKDAVWNTAGKYRIECKYPNDVELVIAGGYGDIGGGTKWIGQHGWVWVDRGRFDASKPEWKKEVREREKKKDLEVLLYDSPGHQREFLDSVKSRQDDADAGRGRQPLADARPPGLHRLGRGRQAQVGRRPAADHRRRGGHRAACRESYAHRGTCRRSSPLPSAGEGQGVRALRVL